jgi:hypothetical protein
MEAVMTIGNQATVAGINQSLSSYAVQLRNPCEQLGDFNLFIAQLGMTGLVGLGFAAADAANVIVQAAVLNTIAALYEGTATQAAEFDFNNALAPLWAGQ